MTTAAGFLLASKLHVPFALFAATLAGTALVIAAACVCNNYLDRKIDAKMARTSKRASVTGAIPVQRGLVFAGLLGALGFAILVRYTNAIVVTMGAVAVVSYVALYGIAKRRSVHGTLVGSIPGAAPIVAGYCAVTGRLDTGALLLFLVLAAWQMPHFYAIAMYRLKDYQAAGLPVWPAVKGIRSTKIQIVAYIAVFIAASLLLTAYHYTGYIYAVLMLAVGAWWLRLAIRGFYAANDAKWAKKTFLFSLVVLMTLSVALPLGSVLP
ncbi:MAG TPA: heme o synthase [Candidatus Saccharimonadales bacterium]|nr:heme o synthase [Candidatus Saccharimonadales bacterium]